MKCPERSEPLGFGLLRAFFPFICAVFRASTFSTGIGHAKEKSSKSEREMKSYLIYLFRYSPGVWPVCLRNTMVK